MMLAAFVIASVGVLGYFQFAYNANPSGNPQNLRDAIQRTAAFLTKVELRGDDAWIATQGALKLGPEFRIWAETLRVAPVVQADQQRDPLADTAGSGVEGNLWALRWLAESPLAELAPPALPPESPAHTALSEEEIFSIIRTMAHTVACHRLGDAGREQWLEELRADSNSYVLTHQLISLVLGWHQGCIDAATAEPLREQLATRVRIEQAMDRRVITDLSIERLAALCYAQLCSWIDDEWLDELLWAQQASGSWGDQLNANVHPRVVAREEHGAAMAFYVLASVWSERFAADEAAIAPPRSS